MRNVKRGDFVEQGNAGIAWHLVEIAHFRVNPAIARNSYRVRAAIAFSGFSISPGYVRSGGKICHGTWIAQVGVRDPARRFERHDAGPPSSEMTTT